MSLFGSAIQNLSQMAIQEAGVTIPQTANDFLYEDVKERLDHMTLLTEDETRMRAEMVPVKISSRLNKYLIEAEDISQYMITNRITNVKEAICHILEAADLEGQYHNVAIVIDEQSILDEMDDLGYVVSDFNLQTPPKGLGLAMVGKQRDFAKIRNIANTKELMDLLTGRYGLPLVKRNYKSVGLLNGTVHEAVEDAQLKVSKDAKVLHEEDPKTKKNAIPEEQPTNEEYIEDDQESMDESFWNPSTGERLASGFRRLTGRATFKDKVGHALDQAGNISSQYLQKVRSKYSANPRKEYVKNLAGGVAGLGTAAAAGWLGHSLYKSRQKENQSTNNTNQTQKIKAANESMTPHELHLQYLKDVAQGKYNE